MRFHLITLFMAATPMLSACEQYTEKTSPCFGRNGKPAVTRAAPSIVATDIAINGPTKDCAFEDLSRPK